MSLVVDVMGGGVAGGTSIMFAALGETVGERSGVINLGTEGSMLVGALTAYAVAADSGSPWMGALAGAVAGGTLAALHAYLVVFRGASQFAVGLSLLFLALGLTSLFGAAYVGRPVVGFSEWDVPLLSHLPALGRSSSSTTHCSTSAICWCRRSGSCCSARGWACLCVRRASGPTH